MEAGTASGRGTIREEYCPSHMQVEWEVSYLTLQPGWNTVRSPAFKIEKQSYKLEWRRLTDGVGLGLSRMGAPISESALTGRYWGGLKRTDGTYKLAFNSGQSELKRREHENFENEAFFVITNRYDVESLYLTSDGLLTFFFRMNTKRSPAGVEICTHGTPQMPKPESGSIRQEECSRHNHVEWNVSYETERDNAIELMSPAFKVGTYTYFFEMSTYYDFVSLHLLRLGRSVHDSAAVVRYWIGLKCHDGTYHPRNFSEKLDLSEDFGLWTRVGSQCFSASDLQERYMTLDRSFTFFFRMNVKTTGEELCIHATHQLPPPAAGSIREEQCSSHKQVEWDVGYDVPHRHDIHLSSPVFKSGTQQYFLNLHIREGGSVVPRLFRLGRSVRGPVTAFRCWTGLKCRDGTYRCQNFNGQLDLREEFGFWTELARMPYISPFEIEQEYLTLDSRLIFFFRMNTEQTVPAMCMHDPVEVPALVSGSLQQDECSYHKHVEWNIKYEALRGDKTRLKSPVFKIGTQMYVLDIICYDKGCGSFRLHRLGHSVECPSTPVRCWAGLKRCNGTYNLMNFNKKLDISEDFGLWTMVDSLMYFNCLIIEKKYLKYDQSLTFFLRMNVEPTGSETCNHGPVEKYAPWGEGFIEMQVCPNHEHVTWNVAYEVPRFGAWFLTSPVFKVGCQWYQLNLCCDSYGHVALELYRSGSPVRDSTSSVHCWAGLRRGDGSYHHHIQEIEFDLSEECSLPTSVASFILPARPDLERTHVTADKRLMFFLEINSPRSPAGERMCAHGAAEMCPPGEGSVRENEGKFVEWNVNYEARREYTHFSTSPVFKIGTQLYLLELCYETDDILVLSLYRSGCSVEGRAGFVRCWAGIKRDYGMYHHKIEGVQFDLRRNCELWTRMTVLGYFRRHDLDKQRLKREELLTFFFLISAEVRSSDGFNDVAVQTDGNCRDGHKDKVSKPSQDLEKLRRHFKLWLKHPEEGDLIRRLRMEEFDKRWKYLEKHLDDDKEPFIFAA